MNTQVATLPSAIDEQQLISVLSTSLYPGAAPASVSMVLAYCKASGLDPMQKPVHIVPMWDRNLGRMKDVIMPGIGLYRTMAARGGDYAGVSEPEFGDDITENIGGVEITYPVWCKVVVKRRLSDGTIADFSAIERWKENYAVKGGKERSIAPNAMWAKRPYGQISKCAEAQALRKAFPEIGAQPTAEEMEGKSVEVDITPEVNAEATQEATLLPCYPQNKFEENFDKWASAIKSGQKTPDEIILMIESKYTLSDQQIVKIKAAQK